MPRTTLQSVALLLALASIAHAGAFIELVPDNPGPYFGGENVRVEVNIHNDDPVSHELRLIQWDLTETDPAITLNGVFDFDLPFGGMLHASFPAYPTPSTAYVSTGGPIPGLPFKLPASSVALSGWIDLTLPADPGEYSLDVLNSDNTDPNRGSILNFGFGGAGDPVTDWRGDGLGDDLLTGGQFTFQVVPEPASLWLLTAGVALLVRRSRPLNGNKP